MSNRKTSQSGFTLVETLVAMGLFGIVMSVAVGGFVRALRTQSQILALISTNSNASLVLEQMAREIRTGINFETSSCFGGSCELLSFVNSESKKVTYKLEEGALVKNTDNGEFKKITADNIKVQYLYFIPQGEQSGDGSPPRITISLGVTPAGNFQDISITRIQTTVSARLLDE